MRIKKIEQPNTTKQRNRGQEQEKTSVNWMLSIDDSTLTDDLKEEGKCTYRTLTIGGERVDFGDGFVDLHIQSYSDIIDGKGFSLRETRTFIKLAYMIREFLITIKIIK